MVVELPDELGSTTAIPEFQTGFCVFQLPHLPLPHMARAAPISTSPQDRHKSTTLRPTRPLRIFFFF
jgi:hypothetical protein